MRSSSLLLLALLVGLNLPVTLHAQPLSKADLSKRGKAATVLVETPQGTGTGFCIDKSGLFLTNQHVIRRVPPGDSVKLILDPNQKTQKVLTATVVRSDAKEDLALLRVTTDPGDRLSALPFGSSENLTELQDIVVFGFPLGKLMSLRQGDYPNIAVSNATISALRNREGVLEAVEISGGAVNPGHSGGPVLDDQGKVIAVVVAGVPGSGISQAIPVAKVLEFLNKPELTVRFPSIPFAQQHKPTEFTAKVVIFQGGKTPEDLSVELTLKPNLGTERKFPMALKDGVYQVQAVPVPEKSGPVSLRFRAQFGEAVMTAEVEDRSCQVGGKQFKLREVATFTGGPTPEVKLQDGTVHKGVPDGWNAVVVKLGGQQLTLDWSKADKLTVEPPPTSTSVTGMVMVRSKGKELVRYEEAIRIIGRSTVTAGSDRSRPGKAPEISPARLDDDVVEVKLPSQVARVVAGGGGRYLFLFLARERQLAIFDASAARIVKYLPMQSETIKFAACADLLLVYVPNTNAIERWNLATLEKEVTLPCPIPGKVMEFVMGSGSHGPLIIGGTGLVGEQDRIGGLRFYEPHSLKEIRYEPVQEQAGRAGAFGLNFDRDATVLRVSAHGQTITYWNRGNSSGLNILLLQGGTYRHAGPPSELHARTGVPTPDGELVCIEGHLLTADGKPLRSNESTHGSGVWFVPAVEGKYHLAYREVSGKQAELTIHLQGEKSELVRYRKIRDLSKLIDWVGGQVSDFDQHLFFIPQAGILAFLPHTRDKLLLYKFDLDAALEASGIDYLVVASAAPGSAKKGSVFEYQLNVKSKRKGVQYQLESGPQGMKVSAEGKVTWDVPADYNGGDVAVILTVRDASGQEVLHSFKLQIKPASS